MPQCPPLNYLTEKGFGDSFSFQLGVRYDASLGHFRAPRMLSNALSAKVGDDIQWLFDI